MKMTKFQEIREFSTDSKFNKKVEICHQIFKKFKVHELYSKFNQFNKIDKLVKQNFYQTHQNLATDIRKIFNDLFAANLYEPQNYNNTFILSNYFEGVYRDYENKTFSKDSKNILELKKKMNKLRKEIRERNNPNGTNLKNTKLRIDINDFNLFNEKEKKISRKYKLSLVNNIRSLNQDQVKGIINIIHDNLNVEEKTMEFDINNLPIEKLKELDRYVKKCMKMKTKPNSSFKDFNSNLKNTSDFNVNININNNFMMGNYKSENNIISSNLFDFKQEENMKKNNTVLSESDSLSSDEESESNSLSSLSFERRK